MKIKLIGKLGNTSIYYYYFSFWNVVGNWPNQSLELCIIHEIKYYSTDLLNISKKKKCKKWIQHNKYFVDYNFCSIVKIVLENNDFKLDSIFARRFWRYNYCEKSFWFFSLPLDFIKNELLLTVKYFLFTYCEQSKKLSFLSKTAHDLAQSVTKSSPFLHIEDLDKIYQIFVKVS